MHLVTHNSMCKQLAGAMCAGTDSQHGTYAVRRAQQGQQLLQLQPETLLGLVCRVIA